MAPLSFSDQDIIEISNLLKIISEPKRLLLLEQIIQGVQCNCELGKSLGMAPNLISHHLGVLRDAGLVDVERDTGDSRWIYYSINPEKFDTISDLLMTFFDTKRTRPRRVTCGPQVAAN